MFARSESFLLKRKLARDIGGRGSGWYHSFSKGVNNGGLANYIDLLWMEGILPIQY